MNLFLFLFYVLYYTKTQILADCNICIFYTLQEHMGLRSSLTLDLYKKAYDHIVEQYPFWNRSSGRDHIWV